MMIKEKVFYSFVFISFFIYLLSYYHLIPYFAVQKSLNKHNHHTSCLFINGKTFKGDRIVNIEGEDYFLREATLLPPHLSHHFPIDKQNHLFKQMVSEQCYQVKYIVVLDFPFYRKLFLYEILTSEQQTQ